VSGSPRLGLAVKLNDLCAKYAVHLLRDPLNAAATVNRIEIEADARRGRFGQRKSRRRLGVSDLQHKRSNPCFRPIQAARTQNLPIRPMAVDTYFDCHVELTNSMNYLARTTPGLCCKKARDEEWEERYELQRTVKMSCVRVVYVNLAQTAPICERPVAESRPPPRK